MPNLAYTNPNVSGPGAIGVNNLGVGVTGVISVNWTEEVEAIDVTHRGSGTSVAAAYRVATGGFISRTIEIECLDASAVMTRLATGPNDSGYQVMSVTENQPLDGPVTYNVTVREG